MKQKGEVKEVSILYQLLLWAIFYIVFYHSFNEEFEIESNSLSLIVYSIVFSCYFLVSIFNIRILFPKYFKKKKYKKYLFYLFTVLLIVSIALNVFVLYLLNIPPSKPKITINSWSLYFFIVGLLYVGMGSFFYLYSHWHYMRENLIKNEKEKIRAELTALRAQINPHLLFNTLNNIYSLSLEKSVKTPEIVLKLSYLMSYVLYDCKKEKVNISSEIEFVNNYVQLEKIRFEDNIKINYKVINSFGDISIAPLIFLPFIENAFKHTGSELNEKPSISVSITLDMDGTLHFNIKNSVFETNETEMNHYSGIGIKNVSKRLRYLYPEQYLLAIERKENNYTVYLKIKLL